MTSILERLGATTTVGSSRKVSEHIIFSEEDLIAM